VSHIQRNQGFTDMNELQAHIEAQNAVTAAWVAEDPDHRWAGITTSDPAHWAEYGITTVYDYEMYMAVTEYQEGHKDIYGVKARWFTGEGMTLIQVLMDLDSLWYHGQDQLEHDRYWDQSSEDREAENVSEWNPTPPPINNPFAAALGASA